MARVSEHEMHLSASERLALRAVPISTRVVRDTLMSAIIAALDMAAERRGATKFDRSHGVMLRS
jgi:hypothetical protein